MERFNKNEDNNIFTQELYCRKCYNRGDMMKDFTNESALLVEMILVFPPLPLTTDLTKQHIYRSSSVVMNFIICLTIMDDL